MVRYSKSFKGDNYLSSLCDYIRAEKQIPKSVGSVSKNIFLTSFQLKGDTWELNYKGSSTILKDAKGLHDIHKLLCFPLEDFHCLDLMGAAIDESNSIESIDSKAKNQYLNRIKELQIDIDEAEEMNQIEKTAKLREEYDSILDYLSQSLGLTGKTRKIGSSVEKARSAITWRIRNAIKKIKSVHPELGNHLSKSIMTGTYCSYKPEITIDWIL